MSWADFIQAIGPLGLFASGSLLGSILTAVVNNQFERMRAKTERQHQLQKEIYFKSLEKADEVLMVTHLYREQVNKMALHLRHHIQDFKDIDKTRLEGEYGVKRERASNDVFLFFPEIFPQYEEVLVAISNILDIYFGVAKKGHIDQDDIDRFFEKLDTFSGKDESFIKLLKTEIEKHRLELA